MSRVALSLFIVSFAVALVAEEAGEGAEEIVEHLAGIRESTIEGHEEWAERSILLTGVLASLAVCHLASSLWLARAHRFLTPLVFVVGLATSATLAITAQKGGPEVWCIFGILRHLGQTARLLLLPSTTTR